MTGYEARDVWPRRLDLGAARAATSPHVPNPTSTLRTRLSPEARAADRHLRTHAQKVSGCAPLVRQVTVTHERSVHREKAPN